MNLANISYANEDNTRSHKRSDSIYEMPTVRKSRGQKQIRVMGKGKDGETDNRCDVFYLKKKKALGLNSGGD